MQFDRKIFFANFKRKFDPHLEQNQVDGIELLLTNFEKYAEFWQSVRHIAYALATVYHETAASFQPVEEGYYLGTRARAFQKKLKYYPFFGRGYVQLTWEENYEKATKELKRQMPKLVAEFEKNTGEKFDLVKYPQQARNPAIAFATMTLGMHQGWFRKGHDLARYINAKKTDYIWGRYIINGKKRGETYPDKAQEIAADAKNFEAILRISLMEENSHTQVSAKTQSDVATSENSATAVTSKEDLVESADEVQQTDSAQIVSQKADVIVNNDSQQDKSSVPDNFVPETKSVDAPPPAGLKERIKNWWIYLGLVPPTGAGIFSTIKDYAADGTINLGEALQIALKVFTFVFPYVVYLLIAYVIYQIIKTAFQQIVLAVQIYTTARGDMHNVEIKPTKCAVPVQTPKGFFSRVMDRIR